MSEADSQNPFASPQTSASIVVDEQPNYDRPNLEDLPSRWLRLGAAIFDYMLVFAATIPLAVGIVIVAVLLGVNPSSPGADVAPFIGAIALSMVLFTLINYSPLTHSGQTWGKKLCGIKIVCTDGSPADLFRLVGARYVLFAALAPIPVLNIAYLLNVLYIFGSERRCLHDVIADTIVVKANQDART